MTEEQRRIMEQQRMVRQAEDLAAAHADLVQLRIALTNTTKALVALRDWVREGKGNEADVAELVDAALHGRRVDETRGITSGS